MTKLILILAFFTLLTIDKYPADISGTWVVDNVDLGNAPIPPEKRDMALIMAQETFRNVVLNFKADHSCTVTPNRLNLPEGSKWEYSAATGIIKITGTYNGKPRTIQLNATEKGGKVYFGLQKFSANLQVHKK